eukprot:3940622-Rhodomonas_salina.2
MMGAMPRCPHVTGVRCPTTSLAKWRLETRNGLGSSANSECLLALYAVLAARHITGPTPDP